MSRPATLVLLALVSVSVMLGALPAAAERTQSDFVLIREGETVGEDLYAAGDVVFIAVQTPMSGTGEADLQYVMNVGAEIGGLMERYLVIVTKSTVPVRTAYRVRDLIQAEIDSAGKDVKFSIASNPEFLREGAAIQDFIRPDRVVIGADDDVTLGITHDAVDDVRIHG